MARALSLRAVALGALLAASAPLAGNAAETLVGVANVIDGDTIEIQGKRVRLHGIDAPESGQECSRPSGGYWRCGQQAALALADKVGRGTVRCEKRDRDRYGRLVAVCFRAAEDLNRWLVANGWAVAYRRYSMDYVADEKSARQSSLNIWAGEFDMPWEWRASRRRDAAGGG